MGQANNEASRAPMHNGSFMQPNTLNDCDIDYYFFSRIIVASLYRETLKEIETEAETKFVEALHN